jgi:photosystem II stability/assembly factor-like uncharacterized protein
MVLRGLWSCVFSLTAVGTPASELPVSTGFGALPLYFEANRGQTDDRVQFFARGREQTIYLSAGGATIALKQNGANGSVEVSTAPSTGAPVSDPARLDAASLAGSETGGPLNGKGRKVKSDSASVRFVRMNLVGANAKSAASGVDRLRGRVNYLLGNDPTQWQQGVPTFARVRYDAVYPGVDVVYYGNEQELEYDFFIAPRSDPSPIELQFDGADRLEIDARGDLILQAGPGQLRQHKPVAYQVIAGVRRDVPAHYQLKDRHTVAFALDRYDRAHPLVIDPILSYSTYIGGSKGDIGWGIAVDANGSAYVAGDTLSIFKKLPVSGQQTNSGGGTKYGGDAFVARLDFTNGTSTNVALGYLTYLGGNGLDSAIGVAVDAAGAAYLTGYTTSSNFPVFPSSVFQTDIGGTNVAGFNSHYSDAFVTKLDANGFGVYSTYLGGEFGETGSRIAVDAAGAAYVVGYTDSALIFRATNWLQTTKCTNVVNCTNAVCVTNYSCGPMVDSTNTTMVRLLLPPTTVTNYTLKPIKTTRTATTTNTVATTIETIVVTTVLDSERLTLGFPILGAVQTNNAGAGDVQTADIFISKLAADGSALIYSTYLGGPGRDFGTDIAVDAAGNATVSGWTDSFSFPVTNAIQPVLGGLRDAIVAKLDASGSLIYSTYLGGSVNDVAYGIAVDAAGAAYVTGAEGSTDFPSTPGAFNRGGVFISDAGGANWTNTSSGLTHTIVRALLADAFNPGVLYAGTPRGVFKSLDGGATWNAGNTGLVNRSVNVVAVDPSDGTPLFAGTRGGLFTSNDGGLSWTNDAPGLGSPDVRAILFQPGSPTNLFVGTSAGVFVNTNLATNWLARNSGLNKSVRVLAADPSSPSTLYAATDGGVYKSTNGGINWRASSSGLKTKASRAFALDPFSPQTLYLGTTKGFYKSINAATNWTLITNGLGRPTVSALLLDTNAPSTIYAGTTNGLYKSTDAGANWFLSQSNLTTRDVIALAFPAGSTATLYAGTRGTNFAGGTNDAFLVKLAPDGQSLVYALTFGGEKNDEGWGVAVDANGNAFIVGQTASKKLPVAGSFTSTNAGQTNLAGKIDVLVAEFNSTGSSNIFSIYFGGKKADIGHAIALDPSGDAYIIGQTESSKLPTTNVISGSSFGSSRDAFVAKLMTGPPAPPAMTAQFLAASDQLMISWPVSRGAFILECQDDSSGSWKPVPQAPAMTNGRCVVVLPASAASCLFRLRCP